MQWQHIIAEYGQQFEGCVVNMRGRSRRVRAHLLMSETEGPTIGHPEEKEEEGEKIDADIEAPTTSERE